MELHFVVQDFKFQLNRIRHTWNQLIERFNSETRNDTFMVSNRELKRSWQASMEMYGGQKMNDYHYTIRRLSDESPINEHRIVHAMIRFVVGNRRTLRMMNEQLYPYNQESTVQEHTGIPQIQEQEQAQRGWGQQEVVSISSTTESSDSTHQDAINEADIPNYDDARGFAPLTWQQQIQIAAAQNSTFYNYIHYVVNQDNQEARTALNLTEIQDVQNEVFDAINNINDVLENHDAASESSQSLQSMLPAEDFEEEQENE